MQVLVSPATLPQGRISPWWELPKTELDEQAALTALKQQAKFAATAISKKNIPCCDLTGGYDSRGILAMFLDSRHGVKTVVNGPEGIADVEVAKKVPISSNWIYTITIPAQ